MTIAEQLRDEFRSRSPVTMFILGLSMTVTGGLTASEISEIGIGPILGAILLVFGVITIGGVTVWGTGEQAQGVF
jgi:hypothetical protein